MKAPRAVALALLVLAWGGATRGGAIAVDPKSPPIARTDSEGAEVAPDATPAATPEERLLEVDRSFARATREKGLEGWLAYFAEDGIQVSGEGILLTGRDSIRAVMEQVLGNPAYELAWEPELAVVASSDDLGYTYGSYVLTLEAGAQTQRQDGRYVSIWRRDASGAWKLIVDIGNAEP